MLNSRTKSHLQQWFCSRIFLSGDILVYFSIVNSDSFSLQVCYHITTSFSLLEIFRMYSCTDHAYHRLVGGVCDEYPHGNPVVIGRVATSRLHATNTRILWMGERRKEGRRGREGLAHCYENVVLSVGVEIRDEVR